MQSRYVSLFPGEPTWFCCWEGASPRRARAAPGPLTVTNVRFVQQRNWYLDPATSVLHFPSSARHPSRLAATATAGAGAAQGVPVGMATGGIGSGVEDDGRELDRAKVVAATLKYARELESIV